MVEVPTQFRDGGARSLATRDWDDERHEEDEAGEAGE